MLLGNGTTLQAVIDSISKGDLKAKINLVVSDNKNAYALERAKKSNIPTYIIKNKTTEEVDIELSNLLKNYDVDLILAGHSLQGQIKIPFIGGIIKKDGAQTYIGDYYKINKTEMYISGGIGTDNNFNFRFNNKPQINVYRLTSKNK